MSDTFIPSSPQDFAIRPIMRGMITEAAPTQAPDGSFSMVKNLDVTTRGMRRLGGWALGLYNNDDTPIAVPFLMPDERVEDVTNLTLANGVIQTFTISNRFLYRLTLSIGYERIPWCKTLFDSNCWKVDSISTVNAGTQTVISMNGENFSTYYLKAGDFIKFEGNPTYYEVTSVELLESSISLILKTLVTPEPPLDTKFLIYKPFKSTALSFVDFCTARNKLYLVDGLSDMVFEYNGNVLSPLIITDEMGNQTVVGAETITFYGERLYFGNVREGYVGSTTSHFRHRVRWTDVLDFSKSPASYYQDVSREQGRIFKLLGLGPLLMAYTPTEVYYARPTNLTNLPYSFAKLETGGAAASGPKAIAAFLEGQVFVSNNNVFFISSSLQVAKLADGITYDLQRAQGNANYTYCRVDSKQERLLIGTSQSGFEANKLFIFNIQAKAWSLYNHIPLIAPSLLTIGRQLLWQDIVPEETWTNTHLRTFPWATILSGDAAPTLVAFQAGGYLLIYNPDSNMNEITQENTITRFHTPIRIETPDYDLDAPDTDKTALRLGIKIFERELDRLTRTVPIYLQVTGSVDGGQHWKNLGILRIAPQHDEDALNFRLTGATIRFRIDSVLPEGVPDTALSIYEIVELTMRLRARSVEVFRGNARPTT